MPAAPGPREVVALISDIHIADNVRAIRVFVNRDTGVSGLAMDRYRGAWQG